MSTPRSPTIAGPQLVVPVTNARYALNAANARWGSLYDALYGTDALGDLPTRPAATTPRAAPRHRLGRALPRRGRAARPRQPCRRHRPIASRTARCAPRRRRPRRRSPIPAQFAGYRGRAGAPTRDPAAPSTACMSSSSSTARTAIGATDPAGIADVLLEAALTTIMDCEDSVAAVDAEDKVAAYRNWLGLMQGDLAESVRQGRPDVHPPPQPRPRLHRAGRRSARRCTGRALMLVRNVGHLMTNPPS